jgi:hypothetical protein
VKKKLKVKKAGLGMFFKKKSGGKPTPLRPRIPGMRSQQPGPIGQLGMVGAPPQLINQTRPGMQQSSLQIINGVKQLPDPSTIGSNMVPRSMQPSSQIDPSSPRSLPFASAVGPSMQGVGDPRLGAATIPGNQLQMQMRGPTQAAPVQPVPAMKKGGAVRGVRIALRGAKKATIY